MLPATPTGLVVNAALAGGTVLGAFVVACLTRFAVRFATRNDGHRDR